MRTLHANIWRQGTVCEATAFAVPFLIDLVEAPTVEDKDQILILLSHLANGSSYGAAHQHLSHLLKEASTPEWQEQMKQEMVWVQNARKAVIAGEAVYLGLLSHRAGAVREAAVYLLASLERPDPDVAARLWEQFEREAEDRVRASLLLGIGYLAPPLELNHSLSLNASVVTSVIQLR